MRKFLYVLFFILVIILSFFSSTSKKIENVVPLNLNKNHECVVDSMIIINYNGPKAQILWHNGKRSFYCEVKEAFYEKLDNVKSKQIVAFYVQDFSNLKWGSYINNWILADKAVYVIDSSKDGAMGITYVPFTDYAEASKFLNLYGGKLVKFDDINLDTLFFSSSLMKNRLIQ